MKLRCYLEFGSVIELFIADYAHGMNILNKYKKDGLKVLSYEFIK